LLEVIVIYLVYLPNVLQVDDYAYVHCVKKNWTTKLMAITFSNLNRFSPNGDIADGIDGILSLLDSAKTFAVK